MYKGTEEIRMAIETIGKFDKELMVLIQFGLIMLLDETTNDVLCSDEGRREFTNKMCQVVIDIWKGDEYARDERYDGFGKVMSNVWSNK
jgi:hypothetical protein